MAKFVLPGSVVIFLIVFKVLSGFTISPSLQSSTPSPSQPLSTITPMTPSITPQPTQTLIPVSPTTTYPIGTPQPAMPPITVDTKGSNWTIVVSVIAACISLVSLFVSWHVYRRDRSDLRISRVNFFPSGGVGAEFLVWVVNAGRRPVLIEEVLLRLSSGEKVHIHSRGSNPIGLGGDGERHRFAFPLARWGENPGSPLDVVQVEVYDTTRKKTKLKLAGDVIEAIRKSVLID